MSELITVEASTALASHRAATDAAGVCREIVTKTAQTIQGRKYVRVEGWQSIANAFGCVASAVDVEKVEGGVRAIGQVRRVVDGVLIATAEGFVGDDEKTWASRNEFARRAMAQTRAISRACRSAFAFVVTMMDAGLETTPAEEMSGLDERPKVEYRPKPAPANLERRGSKRESVDAMPAPLADDPMAKARLSVSRATSLDDLDKVRRRVEERTQEGKFSPEQHDELVKLCHGKAELLIGSEEGGE